MRNLRKTVNTMPDRYDGMDDVLLPVPGVKNSSKEQYKESPARAWTACIVWLCVTAVLALIALHFWGGVIFADVVLWWLFVALTVVGVIASFLPVLGWWRARQERQRNQRRSNSHH
jgi:hypothetical protein